MMKFRAKNGMQCYLKYDARARETDKKYDLDFDKIECKQVLLKLDNHINSEQ